MTLQVLTPTSIGSVGLRNRAFQSAHSTNFGTTHAGPNGRYVAYQAERARGGIGLIITEGIRVYQPTWRPGRLGGFTDAAIADFQVLTRTVHDHGARIFAQLNEPGRHLRLDRSAPISASELPWTLGGVIPHALTIAEIGEIVDAWGDAARRMEQAGFDGIEVQCSHGHLINQFLSPATNRRSDEYGGGLQNRIRFARRVLEAVAARVNIPVGIRISADEFQEPGLGLQDSLSIAEALVGEFPVAYINVTQSFYEADYTISTQAADMTFPPAPFRSNARAFKERCPDQVILMVCRIDDLDVGEDVIRAGDADMVGMARPQIADPAQVAKYASGRQDTLRHCIHCNQGCLGRTEVGLSISCVVNPEVGLENEWAGIPPVTREARRRVLVVGGGPAGLEAALTAARRGHTVRLAERSSVLGGKIRSAAGIHGRSRFAILVDELERDVRRERVRIDLNCAITADSIGDEYDSVVLATGSRAPSVSIPGYGEALTPEQVIDGAPVGTRAVVLDEDGHWAGAGLAEHLGVRGHVVDYLTPGAGFAWNVTLYSRTALQRRVGDLGVKVRPFRVPVRMDGSTLWVRDVINGDEEPIESVDTIIYSGPRVAEASLAIDLLAAGDVDEVWQVGDAFSPRTALEATYEGHLVGAAIGVEDLSYFSDTFQTFRRPIRRS